MSAVVAVPPVKPGDQSTPSASPAAPAAVEFRYTQTDSFVELLHQLGASLLVSTYQANKLLAVRAGGGGLSTLVRTFDKPMGLAAAGGRLALGTRKEVWFLRNAPDIAPRVEPAGRHDACFVPRSCARHRRHRRPRTRLGGRGAVGGEHALLVPLYAAPRLQLRAAVAAAVRHRPGRRGPLPSERPGHRGRPAQVRHRPGRDRHGRTVGGPTSPGAAA